MLHRDKWRDGSVAAIEDDGTILYSILTCSLPDPG
jgi:hypothetical protein